MNKKTKINIPLARPWFDEEEARVAAKVVSSRWLIFGKETEEFEKEFAKTIGVKYAIAVNSGSSALLVALAALGVKYKDEVIVPNMTFVSTASAAIFLGAIPVFADIELKTYCIDYKDIERRITSRTKVIIPVHYAGQSAQMDQILALAKRHKLIVLEDAAEAHLSEYNGKKCGVLGDTGIFSFTPTKPMTTGEGGMIVTNNEKLARRCRLIKNFGDTDKFKWNMLGFNFRMPEIMGAMGRVQLKKLHRAIEIRRRIGLKYNDGLKGEERIILPYIRNLRDHNFQLYTIRLNLDALRIIRDEFIYKLSQRGISSRLYYPTLHNQKVFKSLRKINGSIYPNSVEFARTALSLPIYPDLTASQVNYIINSILDIIRKYKR